MSKSVNLLKVTDASHSKIHVIKAERYFTVFTLLKHEGYLKLTEFQQTKLSIYLCIKIGKYTN